MSVSSVVEFGVSFGLHQRNGRSTDEVCIRVFVTRKVPKANPLLGGISIGPAIAELGEPTGVVKPTLGMRVRKSVSAKLRAEIVPGATWEALATERESSRERGVEGMLLKRRDAPYGAGRIRDPWWKWKIDPFTIDTVMIYAQRGHGRRAALYTDDTLDVWDGGELVPVRGFRRV